MEYPDGFLNLTNTNGQQISALILMATTLEYGDALKAMDFTPAIIGVGPIQAAMNTARLLKDLEYKNALPDLVINLGSAGSDQYDQKTILQASAIAYRDMDASPFGFGKGQTPFSNFPAILPITIAIPNLESTTISTGANVVSDFRTFEQETAEMEAYAVYSACLAHTIPFIKIVGISDGKQALNGNMEDWTQCLPEIDEKLAQSLNALKKTLKKEDLALPATLL